MLKNKVITLKDVGALLFWLSKFLEHAVDLPCPGSNPFFHIIVPLPGVSASNMNYILT